MSGPVTDQRAYERRVVVKSQEPPARRMFTLAHEVGHCVWR
jgi:Zn-dependent peptidase ImmA (M78 family)